MTAHTLTLDVPESLFERIRQLAERQSRTVGDQALDLLAHAVPQDALPDELAESVGALSLLDDDGLIRAAGNASAAGYAEALEALHHKAQREGLTPPEHLEVESLTAQYERALLVRARAIELLKTRGRDVSEFLVAG